MSEVKLNDELTVTIPEGFHVMDEEEQKQVFSGYSEDRWSIRDEAGNTTVSIMWNKLNFLQAAMANLDATAAQVEQAMSRNMRDYLLTDSVSPLVGGEKSKGFCYTYSVGEEPYTGEWLALRHKRVLYIVAYYAKNVDGEPAWEIFDRLLETFRF